MNNVMKNAVEQLLPKLSNACGMLARKDIESRIMEAIKSFIEPLKREAHLFRKTKFKSLTIKSRDDMDFIVMTFTYEIGEDTHHRDLDVNIDLLTLENLGHITYNMEDWTPEVIKEYVEEEDEAYTKYCNMAEKYHWSRH